MGNEFEVIEELNGHRIIKVFRKLNNDGLDVDTYVKISNLKDDDKWTLIEVQRDRELVREIFHSYKIGMLALYLSALSILDYDQSNHKARTELRNVGNDLYTIEKTFKKYVSESYFSLFKEKKEL